MIGEETLPTFFMADFNVTPSSIEAVRKMIDDDLWEDIGEKLTGGGQAQRTHLQAKSRSKGYQDRRDIG